ncbi:amidase [Allocatelliglobosispora scoriae]|uniref:Amidase n=2 Tax=Allocatelliglobosispora scoriae TaxID=643052 RepID=A0A841BSH0_9ACTN|nr:amidase family protein [Allocatelliglobosispora scoriae]MBB5870346.1 amidase [Allocatelliglobosispora scoriae]
MAETWVGATAKQIARAVRRGDTSATRVVADHLDQIRAHDAELNAFRVLRPAEAAAEAAKVDDQPELSHLPLAGVPIAVKENTAVAGSATWNGSAAASSGIAEADHEVVRRLRGAGAVVVGLTRMPELGLWAVTDDETAVTRNPWQLDRTPGGSSGGAAAAVAAGLVPIAHCNDGLGSIRIPAACCGLLGLKPGRGVVPAQMGADDWFGLVEHGMLTTTVADAAVGFAVLAGRDAVKLTPPSALKVAVSLRSPVRGITADTPNREAVDTAAGMMRDAGHAIVGADPAYPSSLGLRGMATWFAAAWRDAAAAGIDPATLQARTRRHIALGEWSWRRGYVRETDRTDFRERSIAFFTDGGYDVLMTPALATTPPAALDWHSRSWTANMRASMQYAPFAAPWNIAGLPAMTVPVGVRPDGIPSAVQLVGPPGSELLLLSIAGQLELQAPWQRHAPGWPR